MTRYPMRKWCNVVKCKNIVLLRPFCLVKKFQGPKCSGVHRNTYPFLNQLAVLWWSSLCVGDGVCPCKECYSAYSHSTTRLGVFQRGPPPLSARANRSSGVGWEAGSYTLSLSPSLFPPPSYSFSLSPSSPSPFPPPLLPFLLHPHTPLHFFLLLPFPSSFLCFPPFPSHPPSPSPFLLSSLLSTSRYQSLVTNSSETSSTMVSASTMPACWGRTAT